MNQLIITGLPLDSATASSVRLFCELNNLFAVDWCHPDGTIGYIDSSNKLINEKQLRQELEKLAKKFTCLKIGVSLMSGKPKNYNFPIVEFLVENGRVKIADMPHHGHDAPKRYKENI